MPKEVLQNIRSFNADIVYTNVPEFMIPRWEKLCDEEEEGSEVCEIIESMSQIVSKD